MRAAGLMIAGALLSAGAVQAQPRPEAFVPRFNAFLDRMQGDPSAPPAFAVVVVHRDRVLTQRVRGARDLRTGAPLTFDTPIYTASVTKSPVGLLAAQLDAKGLLPLQTTLAQVWPGLRLETGQDPARITARSFLSHVSGIEAPAIQWRYSDTGEYAATDVPALLPGFATRANRAYDYGNVGPVIYTAMAEARLGKSWRDLLQEHVLRPLDLRRTSARLEDFAPAEVAHCNARIAGEWRPVPHKPTALLDAGGGVYSSARDSATYLRAFTSDGASARGAISAAALRKTYEQAAEQNRDVLGFRRTGYGLGWDLSDYDGHKVVSRSGGSAGCRTIIAFVPEHRFGIVVFTLGDAGGNAFNFSLVQQAVDYWTGRAQAETRAERRLAAFSTDAAKAIADLDKAPSAPSDRRRGASADSVGWYRAEGFGRIAVSLHPEGLEAGAGVLRLLLAPAGADRFQAWNASLPGEPWELSFRRKADGTIDALTLAGTIFRREEGERP